MVDSFISELCMVDSFMSELYMVDSFMSICYQFVEDRVVLTGFYIVSEPALLSSASPYLHHSFLVAESLSPTYIPPRAEHPLYYSLVIY